MTKMLVKAKPVTLNPTKNPEVSRKKRNFYLLPSADTIQLCLTSELVKFTHVSSFPQTYSGYTFLLSTELVKELQEHLNGRLSYDPAEAGNRATILKMKRAHKSIFIFSQLKRTKKEFQHKKK